MERPRGTALLAPRKRRQPPRARRRRQRIASACAQPRRRSQHCRLQVERQLAARRAQLAGEPQRPRHQRRRSRVAPGLPTRSVGQRVPAVRASRVQRRQRSPTGAAPSRRHVSAALVYVHVVTRHERSRAAPQATGGKPGLMGGGATAIAFTHPTWTSRGAPTIRGLPGTSEPEAVGTARGPQSPDGGQGRRLGRATRIPQWKAREARLSLCVEDRRRQPRELLALHFHRTTCLNHPSRGESHSHQGRGASAPTTTTRRNTPDPPRQLRRTPGREGVGTASQRARGACHARTHARDGTAVGAAPEAPRQHRDPRQLPSRRGSQAARRDQGTGEA